MKAGYVPIDEIGPVISELVKERWPHSDGYEVLAEKIGSDPATVRKLVDRHSNDIAYADFDTVDRILCALGRQDMWWGRFNDIYMAVEFRQTCELPACNKRFPENPGRGHRKRYCSFRCRNLAVHARAGRTPGKRMRNKGLCYRGHPLSGDNLYVYPSGTKGCKACRRAQRAAYRERKKAAA